MDATATDKGVGLALVAGMLALAGAGTMAATGTLGSTVAGAGFALAVAFGCLAIVALHVYPE